MKHRDASLLNSAMTALSAAILWAQSPAPHISVAAFTDNNTIDENALLACLAEAERDRAHAITDPVEKRHYILRRCFQRVFVKTILKWQGALDVLEIEHQLDTRPQCWNAPSLRLSFSSSGLTALACASTQHSVGIDIEKQRPIENVVGLAERFFSSREAETIAAMPKANQNIAFLKHWTAKEAGLKAIGKGIEFGLNSFVLKPQNLNYNIDIIDEFMSIGPWAVKHLDFLPSHIVAVVHNYVAAVHNLEK